ncbi:hypothetical protein EDB19DRAFT_1746079 [Suillus lakei]|nr:hypothetical protein EDB19DRAFT_1746079 [Suillus lakei]
MFFSPRSIAVLRASLSFGLNILSLLRAWDSHNGSRPALPCTYVLMKTPNTAPFEDHGTFPFTALEYLGVQPCWSTFQNSNTQIQAPTSTPWQTC